MANDTARPPSLTEIRVQALSARDEAIGVFRAASAVVFAAYLAIGLRHVSESEPTRDLLPFQVLFRSLGPQEQRLFRELREGLVEAENLRAASAERRWPALETLVQAELPPFSGSALTWSFRQEQRVAEYVGTPKDGGRSLLLLLQEAEPGTEEALRPERVTLDETHRRIGDGTIVHATIWVKAGGAIATSGVDDRPFQDGWTQIVINPGGAAPVPLFQKEPPR